MHLRAMPRLSLLYVATLCLLAEGADKDKSGYKSTLAPRLAYTGAFSFLHSHNKLPKVLLLLPKASESSAPGRLPASLPSRFTVSNAHTSTSHTRGYLPFQRPKTQEALQKARRQRVQIVQHRPHRQQLVSHQAGLRQPQCISRKGVTRAPALVSLMATKARRWQPALASLSFPPMAR